MFSAEREELRLAYFDAWQKYLTHAVLTPHESALAQVILLHPEYHGVLESRDENLHKDFTELNPFLHMSLHVALREQLATDRPAGIHALFQNLCQRLGNQHDAEHHCMECLSQIIWEAHESGKMPDEKEYLANLSK